MISFASSLDTVGIFTRSVPEAAATLDVMCGKDELDSSSRAISHAMSFYDQCKQLKDLKGVKIGIPVEYSVSELSDEISSIWTSAIQLLQDAGATVQYVSLPHTKYALFAYYVIAPAEASSNLARYDGIRYGHRVNTEAKISLPDLYTANRTEGFGDEVKRRIVAGTFALSVEYVCF